VHRFNSDEKNLVHGDMITARVKWFNQSSGKKLYDSNIGPTGEITFPLQREEVTAVIYDALIKMNSGDSVSFIAVTDTAVLRAEMFIVSYMDKSEYDLMAQTNNETADFKEKEVLLQFLETNNIPQNATDNGLYIIPEKNGTGIEVAVGKTIEVSYKGYFLNGTCFDSITVKQPLEFIYGNDMQVIAGIDVAIGKMKEGDKSKIIIPSHLAFGEKGSTNGLVPPFTTLLYELEILKVK
jgi:FKBP-type peptidyl-prolyl cis-trans isomerase